MLYSNTRNCKTLQSVDVASEEPEILEIPRKIPPWAIAVIIVLNSVIIILVLLLVLGVVWKRYSRLLYYKIVTTLLAIISCLTWASVKFKFMVTP